MGSNYFDAVSQKSGEKVTGAGPDTQMIAVRPGEIVVNKETVDAVGADHFLGLNKMFGGAGANKPKTAKVQTASGGGLVLPTFSSGGMVGAGMLNLIMTPNVREPSPVKEGRRSCSSASVSSGGTWENLKS